MGCVRNDRRTGRVGPWGIWDKLFGVSEGGRRVAAGKSRPELPEVVGFVAIVAMWAR